MNDDSRDDSEGFAILSSMRDFKVSPVLERRLEARLEEFRSQLRAGTLNVTAEVEPESQTHRDGRLPRFALVFFGGGSLAVAIVLFVVLLASSGSDPAWAQVAATVRSMDWIHFEGVSTEGRKVEWWVGKNRCLAVKSDDAVFFDEPELHIRYVFDPEKNIIERRELSDTPGLYRGFMEIFGAMENGDSLVGKQPRAGARRMVVKQDVHEVEIHGKRFLEFEFIFDDPQGGIGPHESVYRVDPNTRLPIQLKKRDLGSKDFATYAMDFPTTGPSDIYALGVSAEIPIIDAAKPLNKTAKGQLSRGRNDLEGLPESGHEVLTAKRDSLQASQPSEDIASHRDIPNQGVQIMVPLDAEELSNDILKENIGHRGISIYARNVKGTINGEEHDDIVVVIAHNCELRAFKELNHDGKQAWEGTFFVPQDSKSDGSNRILTQTRIDRLRKMGVQFQLDCYQGQVNRKLPQESQRLLRKESDDDNYKHDR